MKISNKLRLRALTVIETLCCRDDSAMSNSREAKLLTDIYKFSHLAVGHCKNPHDGWVNDLNTLYDKIKGVE